MKSQLARPSGRSYTFTPIHSDSPVEQARKASPCGDGSWAGYAHVYANIAKGAEKMAQNPHLRCSEDHVQTMADLGSGDENRMKYRQMWLRQYGYIA
jgi:hypothetical protein